MAYVDIFNGDADGICALTQLRLAEPRDSRLVTGVKRDIALLAGADIEPGDEVTVLDISLDKNRDALLLALEQGASCLYVDHHFAGEIPEHAGLDAIINTAPDVCTSILVNQRLQGAFAEWAVVGAYGDNLKNSARTLAKPLQLSDAQLELLERLGTYINYNGYGAQEQDLHFRPAELFELLRAYESPFQFVEQDQASFDKLEQGYLEDMAQAKLLQAESASNDVAVYILPEAPWARRVSGVFSNDLANEFPDRGHAVLTLKSDGNYLVSVRAPLNNKHGADDICRQFDTGGGRKAAAGINDLPSTELQRFINVFSDFYKK